MLPSLHSMVRAALGAAILITLVLYIQKPARTPTKPQPPAPSLDPIMVRLLNRAEVWKELRFSPEQAARLRDWAQRTGRQRREASKEMRAAPAEQRKALQSRQREREAMYRRELAAIFERGQVVRLQQIKLHALGPAGAFLADGRAALHITPDQGSQFKKAVAAMQEAIYQDFKKQPLEPDEAAALARVRTLHAQRKAELEEHILRGILSPTQREQFELLRGPAPGVAIDLAAPRSLLRSLKQRLPQPVARLLLPYTLFELVQARPLLDLLQVSSEEAAGLAQCAQEWKDKEEAFYKSLEGLKPSEQAAKRATWGRSLSKEWKPHEERLQVILGNARFLRLQQVQRQVQGPGAIYGLEMAMQFGVTQEQRAEMAKQLREHMAGFQKQAAERTERRTDTSKSVGDHYCDEHAAILLGVLTAEQRQRWAAKLGAPVSEADLATLGMALRDLRGSPVLR